MMELVQR
jgi:Ca2+-binding EF-hand superfamily protein